MRHLTFAKPPSQRLPWVIARVDTMTIAVMACSVREMMSRPEITPIPRSPDWIRGVLNWRGKIIPCIDLRVRLGLPRAEEEIEELVGTISARAAEHLEWVEDLYNSVQERRPFTKTTDPHACAFGRWYDSYRPKDLIVSSLLRKIDAPHKAIHALATRIAQLKSEQKFEEAEKLIQSHRQTTLQRLLDLLAGFETALHESFRPVCIILQAAGAWAACQVDTIEAVESLDPAGFRLMEDQGVESASDLIAYLGQRDRGAGTVGLVDESRVLPAMTESTSHAV